MLDVNQGYTIGYSSPMAAPRPPRAAVRRARERKIVDATRALFDERGAQDAHIDHIARRVGIIKQCRRGSGGDVNSER